MPFSCRLRKKVDYLPPDEEWERALWRSDFARVGLFILLLSSFVLFIALLTSFERIEVPKKERNLTYETYVNRKMKENATKIIGEDGRPQILHVKAYLRDKKQKDLGKNRTGFGSSFAGWCHPDHPHERFLLPSILRTIEHKVFTQVVLRFLVLATMCSRALYSWFRVCKFRICNPNYHWVIQKMATLLPVLLLIECIFGCLVTILHQDIDEELAFLMPWSVLGFGIMASIHMLSHILLDCLDRSVELRTLRELLRIGCLLTLALSTPHVYWNFIPFTERKICHTLVSPLVALAEYSAFLSMIVFNITCIFDFPNITFALASLRPEFVLDGIDPNTYKPAYLEKS